MGYDESEEDKRLSSILSKINDEKIIMYAICKDSNKADMIKIAGSEQRIILNNFTDSYGTDVETVRHRDSLFRICDCFGCPKTKFLYHIKRYLNMVPFVG